MPKNKPKDIDFEVKERELKDLKAVEAEEVVRHLDIEIDEDVLFI
ncbi:MAG: hypothetical protein WCY09_10340 [Candidatus Omnitrophota bacterium]